MSARPESAVTAPRLEIVAGGLLKPQEAAEIMRCSSKHVRNLMESGQLDYVDVGNQPGAHRLRQMRRIPRKSLENYMARMLRSRSA